MQTNETPMESKSARVLDNKWVFVIHTHTHTHTQRLQEPAETIVDRLVSFDFYLVVNLTEF